MLLSLLVMAFVAVSVTATTCNSFTEYNYDCVGGASSCSIGTLDAAKAICSAATTTPCSGVAWGPALSAGTTYCLKNGITPSSCTHDTSHSWKYYDMGATVACPINCWIGSSDDNGASWNLVPQTKLDCTTAGTATADTCFYMAPSSNVPSSATDPYKYATTCQGVLF